MKVEEIEKVVTKWIPDNIEIRAMYSMAGVRNDRSDREDNQRGRKLQHILDACTGKKVELFYKRFLMRWM